MIGSKPANSERKAQKKTTDKTKMYCEFFSPSNLLKNQRETRGTMKIMTARKIMNETPSRIQSWNESPPWARPVMTAKKQKHRSVGQNCPAHGHRHRFMFVDAQFGDNRVGHKGMRSKHAGHQEAGLGAITQNVNANWQAQAQGNRKCQEPKQQASVPIARKFPQVKVQPGNKHDVQQSNGPEEVDRFAFQDNIETMRANDHARNYQAYDSGHTQAAQHERCHEDNKQDRRKDEDWLLEWDRKILSELMKELLHGNRAAASAIKNRDFWRFCGAFGAIMA
jgi:hypothetical protein